MKYIDLNKISDPFIRQLIDEMGVTGFTMKTGQQAWLVGQPTQPQFESLKDMRERWKRFYILQKREVKNGK